MLIKPTTLNYLTRESLETHKYFKANHNIILNNNLYQEYNEIL